MDEKAIDGVLESFGLKDRSKKIFLFLLGRDVSPASEIAFALNLPKSSAYDSLDELVNKSLVVEYSTDKSKEYSVIDPEQLVAIHNERIEQLKKEQENLVGVIRKTKKVDRIAKPKIKFYAGPDGVKQAFRDNLWNKKVKRSYAMWPAKDMYKKMGLQFSIWHNQLRIKNKIHLDVIHTESDRDFLETIEGAEDLVGKGGWFSYSKEKTAPKDHKWRMSFWIYGNKCLFASGGDEQIAFTVESKEFADLMLLLWKQMWAVSK